MRLTVFIKRLLINLLFPLVSGEKIYSFLSLFHCKDHNVNICSSVMSDKENSIQSISSTIEWFTSGQTLACEKPDGSLLRRRNCYFL